MSWNRSCFCSTSSSGGAALPGHSAVGLTVRLALAAGLAAFGDFAAGLGLFFGVAFLGAGLLVNASRE